MAKTAARRSTLRAKHWLIPLILGACAVSAQAQVACDGTIWLSQGAAPGDPTTLNSVTTDANPFPFTEVGTTPGVTYNGLAHNPADNFLYAVRDTGALQRIDSDGTITGLGQVGLPTDVSFNSGSFASDGFYYVSAFLDSSRIFRIDVVNGTSEELTLSPTATFFDLAWFDGLLYGINNAGDLVSVDVVGVPAGGTATTTVIGNSGVAGFGAMFSASNGVFGNNNNGGFYEFDVTTGEATLLSGSPATNSNDGAHCLEAPIVLNTDLSVTKTDNQDLYTPGTDITYDIVVTNDGPFGVQNAVVTDALPAGITSASWTCTPAGGAVCGAASGTGAIDDTPDLPVNATVTYAYTITVPADFNGELTNTVTVELPPDLTDPTPENNTATDIDQPVPGILRLQKELPEGRITGDQFELVIDGTNGGSVTTTGNLPEVTEMVTADPATPGETYTLIENAAGTTELTNYVTTWSCENALDGGQTPSGSGSSFSITVNPGDDLTCTLVNTLNAPIFGQCSSGLLLGQNDPTELIDIDISTNPFGYPVIGTAPISYNAMGYNPVDNYIYAIQSNTNVLIRVLPDGSTVELGPVSGLPDPGGAEYNAGEIGPDGTFYVQPSATNTQLYQIDIEAMAATLVTLSTSINAFDLAWHQGLLYTASPSGSDSLFSIDPTSGTVTNIGNTGVNENVGAMYGAPNGIFGAANQGGFFQFDPATGDALLISDSPTTNNNDGAHCVNAPIEPFEVDLSVTKDDGQTTYTPGTDVTYEIVVTNNGIFGVQNAVVTDELPAGITDATWTCTASAGATCGTDSGTGAINDTPDLPVSSTVTYEYTISVPTDYTGPLVNTVTVDLPDGFVDPTPENNTATDIDNANETDLAVTKTAEPDPVASGDVVTYTITVDNLGPLDATNAILTDSPDANQDCTAPANITCTATGAAQCPPDPIDVADLLGAGVVIPSLPVGDQVVFTMECTVTATGL